MRTAVAAIALAGLTTAAAAQTVGTVTLTASTTTADIGETVTIGIVLTDNISGNSVYGFDIEVASAGSMNIAGITAPMPNPVVNLINGATTPTGSTGRGAAPDILPPDLDPSLDGLTVYTFQFTVTSTGSRTFTPMDGAGPRSALEYALEGGVVLLPTDYDEYVFAPITIHAIPGPATLTLLALAPIMAARRR